MQVERGRQAQRVAQRRNGERESRGPDGMRPSSEGASAEQSRNALLTLIALGSVFAGICVTYIVLTVAELLR